MMTFNPNDQVELAPGFDHFYNPDPSHGFLAGAYVGARAKVKEHQVDSDGFPLIFIEWDKEDWRYAGMEDGWTYESHFQLVNDQPIHKPQDNAKLIIRDMIDQAEDDRRCPGCGEDHGLDPEQVEYLDSLMEAEENAINAEGFVLITVHEIDGHQREYRFFDGNLASAALGPEAQEALEQQILHIAAQLSLKRRQK